MRQPGKSPTETPPGCAHEKSGLAERKPASKRAGVKFAPKWARRIQRTRAMVMAGQDSVCPKEARPTIHPIEFSPAKPGKKGSNRQENPGGRRGGGNEVERQIEYTPPVRIGGGERETKQNSRRHKISKTGPLKTKGRATAKHPRPAAKTSPHPHGSMRESPALSNAGPGHAPPEENRRIPGAISQSGAQRVQFPSRGGPGPGDSRPKNRSVPKPDLPRSIRERPRLPAGPGRRRDTGSKFCSGHPGPCFPVPPICAWPDEPSIFPSPPCPGHWVGPEAKEHPPRGIGPPGQDTPHQQET